MFVDRIKVFAQAGKGGRGSVSFRREKFVPKGGPDGGDGGRGGDVVLRAERHVDNLANLFYEPIIKAKDGGHGKGKKMAGRAGANKIVKVPVGTIVWRVEDEKSSTSNSDKSRAGAQQRTPDSDQSAIRALQSEMDLIVDLVRDGEEFVLCRGGAGGKGNVHFKSSRNRAPRQYTDGEEGEQGYFLLELRTIADAGLVGYPNAGKSTLLRKLSAARPKVHHFASGCRRDGAAGLSPCHDRRHSRFDRRGASWSWPGARIFAPYHTLSRFDIRDRRCRKRRTEPRGRFTESSEGN